MLLISEYKNTILVTFPYFLVYYFVLVVILVAKIKATPSAKSRVRKDDTSKINQRITFDKYLREDSLLMAADRTQMNMLEQMVPFLVSFWLYNVFVDSVIGTWVGALYVALRSLYFFCGLYTTWFDNQVSI